MSLVREFHRAFDQAAPTGPPLHPSPTLVRLRARLIREEFEEVMAELTALASGRVAEDADNTRVLFQNLLKELADLRYVVEGCAVTFGLPLDDAYAEVHRSNMSKLLPNGNVVRREDGKVLKGPNYTEADMSQFVPPFIQGELA